MRKWLQAGVLLLSGSLFMATSSAAQDRLKTYPGYEAYQKFLKEVPSPQRLGLQRVTWIDTTHIEYTLAGKRYRYDVRSLSASEIPLPPEVAPPRRPVRERGRQFAEAFSPDNKLRAFYRDRNLWLSSADSSNALALTTAGNAAARTKFGVASWVYGEELDQVSAMWWSPDGSKLAYYGFDEKQVPDYFLQLDQTKLYSAIDTEAYPKAGEPNPVVDLYVYDVATKQTTKIDVRDGKLFENDVVGYYAYHVGWTPDSKELTVNRANRRQNIVDFSACNPATGKCRTVVREAWPASWVENAPEQVYLEDGKRFIWASERTGFRNYYLYDLSGKLLATLTKHAFEVQGIIKVAEKHNALYYMARDGDNHMKLQLHRVSLSGKGDRRLTDPMLNHAITASPDGTRFIDLAQTHDRAPVTRLLDRNGKVLGTIASTDVSTYQQLKLPPVELFTFRAADSVIVLHGMLNKPRDFDAGKKYPLLVGVYAGPATNGANETFAHTMPMTAYGFLVAYFDARSAAGRGKKFLDAIYQKLGTVEVDDQAAGVQELCKRPYVDCSRVGIFGTSYGGYASALAILRHPEVFRAAAASSPVTDWRHYDTIYTERYMWIPQENAAGYDAGSAMTYADKLKGRLMLYYGSADNNVHPNNSMQLIAALQKAGKSFEVQVGPDRGHSSMSLDRMLEFFIENLVLAGK